MAYSLYYNKKSFADAGLTTPPATWEQLAEYGKKLSTGGKWGLAIEGANPSENAHHAFTFSQQYGGEWFDSAGKPTFDTRRTSRRSSGTSTSWPLTRSPTRATPSTRRTSRSPTSPTARPPCCCGSPPGRT
ncbi:extracellular solute-binding protein [Micromonospora sp. M12]